MSVERGGHRKGKGGKESQFSNKQTTFSNRQVWGKDIKWFGDIFLNI